MLELSKISRVVPALLLCLGATSAFASPVSGKFPLKDLPSGSRLEITRPLSLCGPRSLSVCAEKLRSPGVCYIAQDRSALPPESDEERFWRLAVYGKATVATLKPGEVFEIRRVDFLQQDHRSAGNEIVHLELSDPRVRDLYCYASDLGMLEGSSARGAKVRDLLNGGLDGRARILPPTRSF